jgi:predicted nucleotidyltransferase
MFNLQKAFPTQSLTDLREIQEGLEKVFKVSEYLDFPFTVEEVANYFLPKVKITSEQLRSMIMAGDFRNIPFHVRDDNLVTSSTQSEFSRLEREQMSAAKLESASRFSRLLKRLVPFIRTVAVTGSTAYGSADRWDDIDLFIVTKRNRLWLTAMMTLVLVRLNKIIELRRSHLSPFCLSYVHDENGFALESQKNRTNPLFARELLKAKPVAGQDEYRRLLETNDWVGSFYPMPYLTKVRALTKPNGHQIEYPNSSRSSLILDWAEGIAFVFLSRYLRVRAYLTNLKLKSRGQEFRVFKPKISASSCVYTSNFYEWLQSLWGN